MKIAVLATENCMVSAVYGLLDVFFAANFCMEKRYGKGMINEIDCQIVTINDQPVTGYNGISITPTQLLDSYDIPDVIIVSSLAEVVVDCCEDAIDFSDKSEITAWLSNCHNKGSIMASYCTGAFLLASVGILRGKVATTHWRSADLFRKVFPFIKLDSEQLVVDNGDVICSGGAMSYIDLALYLVDKHVGKDVTSDCAKLLVFDPVRQKQSPYVTFKSHKNHEDQPILKAQEWLERHYYKEISINDLADQVGLGSRTFKRRFKLATTENPINYLQRIRVENAKDKLEKTTESINSIIWSVGYEDISSFRQLFKRFTGLTPKDYRHKFT
ncbi:MAG: helix-turn-helix domain-containing protein [Colwelliaceae bacterium]|nr:helix-turn-helix domain-containing protein [Colwelliaceae bacterium]